MRKVSVTLAALVLAALSTVGVVSCQKEKTSSNETSSINTPSKEKALANIIEFKKQLEIYRKNPGAKTGETLSIQEAIMDIENVFNATYSQPEVRCSETSEFTFSLYLTIDTDGNVLLSDLFDLYDQAVVEARNAYSNNGFTNKVFRFMTVELDGINEGMAKLDFRGRSGEGEKSPWQPNIDTCMYQGPFGIDDNYHYDYGKCDGTGVEGADEMLAEYIGYYITSCLTLPPTGMRAIYINNVTIVFDGSLYPESVFYRENEFATCIDFNNMNKLFWSEKRFIFDTIPSKPSFNVLGYVPVMISIEGEIKPLNRDVYYITHENKISYAYRMEARISELGEVQNLMVE